MQILRVSKKQINFLEFVKHSAKESDYEYLITEPVTLVDDETNEILAIYDELNFNTDNVLRVLNTIRYDTNERTAGLKTTSRIFGFSPRNTMRKDFCSSTSLSIQSPSEHQTICELGIRLEEYYRTYNPDGYTRHRQLSEEKLKPEFRINKQSIFTSGIINKNNPLKYHFDTGNFKNVYFLHGGVQERN